MHDSISTFIRFSSCVGNSVQKCLYFPCIPLCCYIRTCVSPLLGVSVYFHHHLRLFIFVLHYNFLSVLIFLPTPTSLHLPPQSQSLPHTQHLPRLLPQVSWIKDLRILTVGRYTYTTDLRFEAIHQTSSTEWTLRVKQVELRDQGSYECQITTKPIRTFTVFLKVVGETSGRGKRELGGKEWHSG